MTTALAPRPRSDGLLAGQEAAQPIATAAGQPIAARMRILVLYAFSRCDCRCGMCDIWRQTESRALDPAAIAAELPQWREAGLERVVLSGGESLMHPQPAALLAALRLVPVTLLTSGISLERHADHIANSSVDEVIVSLDGPDWLHNQIRGRSDAFARLRSGVAALRGAAPGLRLSARCTVQAANVSQMRATVAQARDLGLDGISFLAVDVHSGAFNRVDPAGHPLTALLPDRPGLAALERELVALGRERAASANAPSTTSTTSTTATAAKDFVGDFIAESQEKLNRRLLEHFRAELGLGAHPPLTCNAPWVSAVVESDGSLRPCFFHERVGRWQPGAIPLLDAFAGAGSQAFRNNLTVAEHPTCRRCVCNLNLSPG